ncbi:MAG: hypothetical protein WCJ68_08335 [Chitinophagia bacterium]
MKSEEIESKDVIKDDMVVKKKLDIFNLFYSGAAVVILIGVIAKLLEWPAQDLLITVGLTIEAIVFGVSAVKFVEVQVKRQVATEETLAKLAEGISAISDTMGSAGDDNSSTYVNIQTGAFEGATAPSPADSVKVGGSNPSQGFDLSAYRTDYVAPKNDTRLDKLSIEINPSINESRHRSSSNEVFSNGGGGIGAGVDLNNYLTGGSGSATSASGGGNMGGGNMGGSRNYSDLEQLAITSLAKDLFYHPEWVKFNDSDYVKLTEVFKNLFDKKLPSKESVVLLSQFQVKFPAISVTDLVLTKSTIISEAEVNLLFTALVGIKITNLFEYIVIEEHQGLYAVRNKTANEVVVFGGEDHHLITHCRNFFNKEIIICPNLDALKSSVKFKNRYLVEYLVDNADVQSEGEFASLVSILLDREDDFKKKLLSKFRKVRYNMQTNAGFEYIKNLIRLALSFKDQALGHELFKQLFELQIDENSVVLVEDLVNYNNPKVQFGPRNEYTVDLNEVLMNGELYAYNNINLMLEKLAAEGLFSKTQLQEIFNLNKQNSKVDIYNRLNNHLEKTNTTPTGSQLAFILLYKQYN